MRIARQTAAFVVVIAALTAWGCQLYDSGTEAELDGPLIIRTGKSFGECIGFCWTELEVIEGEMKLTSKQWHRERDERTHRADTDRALWDRLTSKIDLAKFLSLDDRYGCPDCADGGAEWIELETENVRKRVLFEYGDTLAPISDLVLELRSLREMAIEEAGWR